MTTVLFLNVVLLSMVLIDLFFGFLMELSARINELSCLSMVFLSVPNDVCDPSELIKALTSAISPVVSSTVLSRIPKKLAKSFIAVLNLGGRCLESSSLVNLEKHLMNWCLNLESSITS